MREMSRTADLSLNSHGNDVFAGYNRTSRMKANTLKEFYDGRWIAVGDNAKYARSNPSNYDKYLKSSKFVFDGSYFKTKQIGRAHV